jgi:pilus assembly protein CpaB
MLKGKMPLIIAAMLAAVGFGVSFLAFKRKEAEIRKGWNPVTVVVASVDISEGSAITADMIQTRQVPEQFVTASVIKPDSASAIVNQKVLVALQRGDPLLWTQFETSKSIERLSTKVQKKARAITIETNNINGVGGWIRPNDHIDLIGTFKDPGDGQQVAVTLLQNITVMATGKLTGNTNLNLVPENQRDYKNVTLLVIPEEAEFLVLAQELGRLTLSLRNEEDLGTMGERGRATISSLLSGERTKQLQKIRESIIQVIGSQSSSK